VKQYLIVSYAYLVKVGRWDLEPVDGSEKSVVPEEYREAVAEYLID
jgi:hypothetical protein